MSYKRARRYHLSGQYLSLIHIYANYDIVFHVHDEVVIEVDAATADSDYKLVKEIMCMPVSWAPGLILNADGFTADYYQKD